MSYPKELFVSFNSVLAEDLATVGFTLYNDDGTTKAARSTSDVACIGDSSTYHATVTLDDDWTGYVLWDTGTADPLTAVEPVSDPRTQTKQAVDASQTGLDLADGGRLDLLMDAIAGDVAGLDGGSIPAIPTAADIADAVLDEEKGTHAGLLAGVALDATVAKPGDEMALTAAARAALVEALSTLTPTERSAIADALLDRTNGVESGVTVRQTLQRIGAATAGKSEVTDAEVTFTGLDGVTTRISGTVDSLGNRTNIDYDPS